MPVGTSKKRSTSNTGINGNNSSVLNSMMFTNSFDDQQQAPTKFLSNEVSTNNNNKKNLLAIDPKCLSCSGQGSTLISTFKMACLAYAPTSVVYRSNLPS
jgi:hypothetical protein